MWFNCQHGPCLGALKALVIIIQFSLDYVNIYIQYFNINQEKNQAIRNIVE